MYGLENPHPTHLKAVALALDFAQLDLEPGKQGTNGEWSDFVLVRLTPLLPGL